MIGNRRHRLNCCRYSLSNPENPTLHQDDQQFPKMWVDFHLQSSSSTYNNEALLANE